MNEIWARLAWVLASVVTAAAVILIMRNRPRRRRPVRVRQAILGFGVYLFSSATCPDCEAARSLLVGAVGAAGFQELRWESDPGVFKEVGVDAVPTTLIVSETGGSTLYPGRPDQALEALGP